MKCVLYSSDATLGNIDISTLLGHAIENNEKLGITGFLISHSAGFIQYFEGDDKIVDELYKVICSDPRHHNVLTLLEQPITTRMYQEWDMGHVFIEDDRIINMLLQNDGLHWFEFLKQRTLFLYPNELTQQHAN
ncbi:BLUF domain-containing protein [Vibrio fluminensis]|uniref:BLUF domain-containing protein n=1 Tax=Vibrio fluminensis TaxID=2783614 RepID=UPI001888BC64|nr:BLUF domain-containing protein [Vibrio fluminensis]